MRSFVGAAALLGALGTSLVHAQAPSAVKAATMSEALAREEQAYSIGLQAFVYGYPAIELLRIRERAVFDPKNAERVPMNTFKHRRALLDATMRTVVAPNNDTLYSSAWLDLSAGPLLLEVPDTHGRYYVMQFMDAFTNNFAYVGSRTTGSAAGRYAIVPPGWQGSLPAGVKRIEAPGEQVWLLGRTLVDGPADLAAVHALQDQYRLTPLVSPTAPRASDLPHYQPGEPLKFFEMLNAVLRDNPPPADEAGLMALFAHIGVGSGQHFDVSSLDAATAAGLRRALQAGPQLLMALPDHRPQVNGWLAFSPHTGRFGRDYLYRAQIAKIAIAANDPAEAHNFTTQQDAQGQPLQGRHRYVLHFAPGQTPPVNAFWSVTMYELPGGFFVDNADKRYALGDRTPGLRRNADGSLDVLLQREAPPEAQRANWLPAPEGDFELALRCYGPKPEIVDGRWLPPRVTRID
jgi:hypothetical protein